MGRDNKPDLNLQEIVVSSIYNLEIIVDTLVDKGLIAQKEY